MVICFLARCKGSHQRLLKSTITLVAAALSLTQAPASYGQILISTGPQLTFEVATVKPARKDATSFATRTYRGIFTAEHASLNDLLKFAYRVKSDDQLVGIPKWSNTEFFDVNGRVDEQDNQATAKLSIEEMMRQTRLRVQSLLAERFHLSVAAREENRKVYALVVAKGGPKLKEVESSASVTANAPKGGEVAAPPPPPVPRAARSAQTTFDLSQKNRLIAKSASMDMLAQWLSKLPEMGDRTVLNRTGLGGTYDFSLTGISASEVNSMTPPEEAQTSVVTLLREQLGLQLQSENSPIDVLVIESVEHPSAN